MRSAIVVGGGMVGVATALQLQRRGWSVVLVDRSEPDRETSYGNSGFIQNEAVRPYAMPRDSCHWRFDRACRGGQGTGAATARRPYAPQGV